MKIAVEGCCHGELDKIYDTLAYIESQDGVKVDLLLICGDFQVGATVLALLLFVQLALVRNFHSLFQWHVNCELWAI